MENGFFPTRAFWEKRRVFVTGHTGFKGAWLCMWLRELGAVVTGYALAPSSRPNMYDAVRLDTGVTSLIGDIRARGTLEQALESARPEIVFHLAAQPLVREAYASPLETIEVNVQGTANVLHACRTLPDLRSVVVVTSDKCYREGSDPHPFAEDDPLGGRDPYSASKACAEIVTAAFRASFFTRRSGSRKAAAVASARAGNVIGGGDWAKDRIVPDLVRAAMRDGVAVIRNPQAIRPWQHVLDPLAGYLMLARAASSDGAVYSESFNFGPGSADVATVDRLVEEFSRRWSSPLRREHRAEPSAPEEAPVLILDAGKARKRLGWHPRLDLAQAIELTVAWYEASLARQDMAEHTRRQIAGYTASAS
ncbi:MAG: CDP-glucose 4,6-dehydratase [Proteobacteria bacterium]|nr:CDP-glucose 4,6-dehydratase [Pseudomonadota bacterium]MBI3497197.1 CDP-glucose 4,6-dehydratase [Pseudomonadota bacterium]